MTHVPDPSPRPPSARLVLLAPSAEQVPGTFRRVRTCAEGHRRLLDDVQRLRAGVYLHDGAIEASQVTPDGRHALEIDDHAWHVASLHADGRLTGCARFRVMDPQLPLEHLAVWRSALAHAPVWGGLLSSAVRAERHLACRRRVGYAEVGGWAIAQDRRFTHDAVDIALSTYALARVVGGCVGITTATVRHCSSRILRKLGGRALAVGDLALPSYFDPQYRCEMEILRFDSSAPNPRYASRIERLAAAILELPVLCALPPLRPLMARPPRAARAPRQAPHPRWALSSPAFLARASA
jgi:hypothetical protein